MDPRALLHDFSPLIVLGASIAVAWLGSWGCHRGARRLRRLGRVTSPLFLDAVASALRWVIVLCGLYWSLQLAFPLLGLDLARAAPVLSAVYVLAVLLGTAGLARGSRVLLGTAMDRVIQKLPDATTSPSQRAMVPMLQRVVVALIWFGALVAVLDHFDRSLSSVVAALGVGSLAIGLASQQALSNMISGLVLLLDRPFRIGDRVRLPGPGIEIGRVEEMGLRSTHLRLPDGNLLVVPNNDLAAAKIVNYSGAEGVRGEVRLQVPASADVERLDKALHAAAAEEPGILPAPPPRLLLLGLGDKLDLSLTFLLSPEADPPQVEERLRRRVLRCLQALKDD